MAFVFDPAKDKSNVAKHGISLRLGIVIIAGNVGLAIDSRRDYGEVPVNAYGIVNDRLYVCTFKMRENICRIISVRKVRRQEKRERLT